MKGQSILFSHKKDNWQTPVDLFKQWNAEFGFTIDGAADDTNHLVDRWLGPNSPIAMDALTHSWAGERVFVNPPYSMCKEFIAKASTELWTNETFSVLLVPSRTDTKWWHEHVWLKDEPRIGRRVRFLRGRVKFVDPTNPLLRGTQMNGSNNSAPFPSVLIIFGK